MDQYFREKKWSKEINIYDMTQVCLVTADVHRYNKHFPMV